MFQTDIDLYCSSGFASSCVGVALPPAGLVVPGVDEEEGERDIGEIYYTGANNNSNSRFVSKF